MRIAPGPPCAPMHGAPRLAHWRAVALVALLVGGIAHADLGPVAEVVEREWAQSYAAEGVVEAVRQSAIASQVSGVIVSLPVKAGDRVRAGQTLATIDARSAEQAVAASASQVVEAEANLANARRRHERNRDLVAKGFVSQAALDQSEAEFKSAQAQLDTARANAGQARTTRSYTVLTAPYAGIVGATDAQAGDMATPGKQLMTVFDPAELRVTATLPQAMLPKIRLQQAVPVEFPALEQEVLARRAVVVPLADTRTHTAQVRLDLPPVEGLLPGHYARARFATGSVHAIAVPAKAVVRRGEVTAVYVVDAQQRPVLRQVRLGESFAGAPGSAMVQVLAGLKTGERVALEPLRAGAAPAAQR